MSEVSVYIVILSIHLLHRPGMHSQTLNSVKSRMDLSLPSTDFSFRIPYKEHKRTQDIMGGSCLQNNTLYKDLVLKCSPTVFYTKTLNNSKNIRTNIGISLDQDSLSWPWLMLTGKKRKNDYGVSLSSLYTPSSCWFSSMNVSSINFSNPSQIHLHHWPLHCLVTITNYTFITEAHFFACEIVFVWVKTKEILSNYSETILWNIL